MYPYYNEYFGFYNYRNEENTQTATMDEEVISYDEALALIRESVQGEKEDEMFYTSLIEIAPTAREKNIILSIRDDERKHHKILRELYYKFTGINLPEDNSMPTANENEGMTYEQLLEKALFGELDAVKRYRRIMGAMPDETSHTLLMSIMTDELRHANKYNFLITSQR